ncbi:hypothetical protein PS664_01431 [Pseudomonas fluorescens]|nr:hypothetical protein PS664_01431 [Pseudomonas fluorescens]
MIRSVHTKTPVLQVSDPRGLTVRTVNYWRGSAEQVAQVRYERYLYDVVGRRVAEWDPRLATDDSAPANLVSIHSLSHKALATESVDAGWRVNVFAEAGQLVQVWDARGNTQLTEYDQLLRPLAVFESGCTQRHEYAGAGEQFAHRNQCGQLIRHDDAAGTRLFEEYGVNGEVLALRQHFLQALDEPDWPVPVDQRNGLLEPGQGVSTAFHFNALGDLTAQVDAQGNRQHFNQTVDGQLREVGLLLNDKVEPQLLAFDIHYNAQGQIERQTAGNQVVSLLDYCPKHGRLIRLRDRRPDGELLQDLNYVYDPVGNTLSIEDKALPVRFFANQRVEPVKRYTYDSLYQLIEATGWEAGSDNRGPAHLEDARAVAEYRQLYRHDEGGNLLEVIHHGPQQHGHVLKAAKHSNRCLPMQGGRPPTEAEIAAAFDNNGNLLVLDNTRTLHWNTRNQLHQVTPVERDSQPDDTERYFYGADGMRQRKVRSLQTNARTAVSETRYLPGLETRNVGGAILNVITVQAGHITVQVLHWDTRSPRQFANDQYRYNLSDHLSSCSLELDGDARVITRETYHPFGTTALSERGDSSEESYRTLRYSGKERDATGLYYYQMRFYIPWLQRWGSADPAGNIDGLNLYRMVRNNPINWVDDDGLVGKRKYEGDPSTFSAVGDSKRQREAGNVPETVKVSSRFRARHEESEGESESEDPQILYRALRPDETRLEIRGLRPPVSHDRYISAFEHVNRGSTAVKKSKWISASRSIKVAGAWAGESKGRVVKFLKPANALTFDLTSDAGRQGVLDEHLGSTGTEPNKKIIPRVMNTAKASQEVLIDSHVEPAAILEVYQATVVDDKKRAELMAKDPLLIEYDKVFKTRTTADSRHRTVLMKRIYSRSGS